MPSSSGSNSPKCFDPAQEGTVIFQNTAFTYQMSVTAQKTSISATLLQVFNQPFLKKKSENKVTKWTTPVMHNSAREFTLLSEIQSSSNLNIKSHLRRTQKHV